MKKFLTTFFLSAVSLISIMAVPAGMYYDYAGRAKALVSDNGQTIYLLDSDGNVRKTLTVVSENSDGSFVTKDTNTGVTSYQNGYWVENGKVNLNIEYLPRTVTRQ